MQHYLVAAMGLCGMQGFGDAEGKASWSPFCVLPCWGRVGAGAGGSPRTADSRGSAEGAAKGAGDEVFIIID